uniref:Uncharacterized protein n=1 Tax=Setaria viridis TaxID=4556 RepID=A0A4U6V125_SETVI|nr:hypothetical protein SEVIR_4G241700v2 [Setaria viridis]
MATSSCTRRQSGSVFPGELKSYGESGIQLGILLENGLQREGAFCLDCRWGEKSVWHQQQEAEDPVSYAVTADRAIHFTRS